MTKKIPKVVIAITKRIGIPAPYMKVTKEMFIISEYLKWIGKPGP